MPKTKDEMTGTNEALVAPEAEPAPDPETAERQAATHAQREAELQAADDARRAVYAAATTGDLREGDPEHDHAYQVAPVAVQVCACGASRFDPQ